jgi:hypothetical protein
MCVDLNQGRGHILRNFKVSTYGEFVSAFDPDFLVDNCTVERLIRKGVFSLSAFRAGQTIQGGQVRHFSENRRKKQRYRLQMTKNQKAPLERRSLKPNSLL